MSTSPPALPATRKKLKPSARSSRTKNCEAAMNGVAMTTSSEVEKFAHTSSGRRKNDMPGARSEMIVTSKFRAGEDRHQERQRGGDRRRAGELHANGEELLPERRRRAQRRVRRPAAGERA